VRADFLLYLLGSAHSMLEIQGIIFDCDGTLADTMPTHYRAWQIALLAVACTLILLSEAAAVAAFRSTSESYQSPPPEGRIRLIAIAAMTTNLIYLVIVLLDGVASIVDIACRQS